MSLKKFQTFLTYRNQIGNLAFYTKPTDANPRGLKHEATFDRVTPGGQATSGATVFRDGQLIELAENEPDFDDLSGCPVLKMRPQAENIRTNSVRMDTNSFTLALTTLDITKTSSLTGYKYAEVRENGTGVHNFQVQPDATLVIGQIYTRSCILERTANRTKYRIGDSGQSNANVVADLDTLTTLSEDANVIGTVIEHIKGNFFHIHVAWTTTGTLGRFSVIPLDAGSGMSFVGDPNEGFNLHFIQYVEGNNIVDPIFTNLEIVTRSTNSFEFTDLVTKGVFGANSEFSFLFYAPDSIGIGSGNTQAGIQFSNNSTPVWNFWSNSGRSVLRPYSNVESGGYMDFSNIDYTTGEAILCTYDGQTITFYNSSGLLNIFSFDNPQPINELTLSGDVFSYSLESGRFALAPFELTEAEAIAAINEAQL